MADKKLSDELILRDVLTSQKELTNTYNIASNETAGNNGLRSDMLHILMEEHELQSAMFNAAHKKGWYQTEQACPQKIEEAKQKYSNLK